MTDYPQPPPSYQPGAPAGRPEGPTTVQVGFAGPAPQDRVTVLFRLFLAIPHYIVLYLLGVAASIVVIIGWFAALFTGQLPDFAAVFLTGYLRWHTRVQAYLMLLTDTYPPFELDDTEYPARLLTQPGPLNRLAVLFRIFIAIPASIVVSFLSLGALTVVLFVAWIITLVNGQLPTPLYEAYAAVLRYSIRYYGYVYLLSSEYPSGLFGDGPGAAPYPSPPAAPPAPYPAATQPGAETQPRVETQPAGAESQPAAETQPGWPTPGQPPAAGWQPAGWQQAGPATPMSWRLSLSDTARNLVGIFLGLGVLLSVGYIVLIVVLVSSSQVVNRAEALVSVEAAYSKVRVATTKLESSISACRTSTAPITCVTTADSAYATAIGDFASTINSTSMPSGAAPAAASHLAADADTLAGALRQVATATTATQYNSLVASTNLQQDGTAVDSDYNSLVGILSS